MLLITDLDNTLLRRDLSVSAHTVDVFAKCRRQGILIGFASARAENAIDEVKAAAKHITDSNDKDGVANYIELNIL